MQTDTENIKIKKPKKTKEKDMDSFTVGISVIPPLVKKNSSDYEGFEIEIWENIAKKLHASFSYKEYQFNDLLNAIRKNEVDIAFGAITRTSERKRTMNFSFFTCESSLMILINKKSISFIRSVKEFFRENSGQLTTIFLVLFGYMFITAHFLFFLEHKNGVFAGTPYIPGIYEALWLSTSTATTLGYGDIIPITPIGRIFAMLTVVGGLFVFGFLTAQLASALSSTRLARNIQSAKDLIGKRVATKKNTIAVKELDLLDVKLTEVSDINDAYSLLQKQKIDAVVFDSPVILDYIKSTHPKGLESVHASFTSQTYGFAFPVESTLVEKVNKAILEIHESGEYDQVYEKWFGKRIG